MKNVEIYTDGGAKGNPGPGGYGVVLRYNGRDRELSGGFRRTTNNRMELLAAIEGLRALKEPCQVRLYSDSRYLVDGIEKGWAARWRANGWKRNKQGDKALNADLWAELLKLLASHKVSLSWVQGHAGHAENERCDALVHAAATGADLAVDEGYEASVRG
jgi:ribonuclease HI